MKLGGLVVSPSSTLDLSDTSDLTVQGCAQFDGGLRFTLDNITDATPNELEVEVRENNFADSFTSGGLLMSS